ncbi:hypothetical protein [Acinetobacter stercoris]|uniref:Uncharacterized protein n=1 Tax=Acinetobacter stercoris TaxID=2126983 RepID=A0A2U3N2H7_9GAMM|nr:hypothetical protein [Acinetobacter stercoris]SPL71878.1 hypothetical protein KPC_3056 [Acinetobacter stercoris]
MKNTFFLSICLLNILLSQSSFAEDKCENKETTNLSIFKKNDYKFHTEICYLENGAYLNNYLINSDQKLFIQKSEDFAAKEIPEVKAVSIYRSKSSKTPILITINSAYYCCTPQMEGNNYNVNLYEIKKINHKLTLKDITKILGEDSEGFEGLAEGRIHYKFKDILSIKKWLDINYK